jgi:hypothetical protein
MKTLGAKSGGISDVPSKPTSSGSSSNSGTGSGSSGGAGGGSGKGGGGGENSSAAEPASDKGNMTKKALLVILMLGAVCTIIIAISSVFVANRSTSPEGMAQTLRLSELADKENARKHAEKMEELKLKQARELNKRGALKAQQNTVLTCFSPKPGTTLFWQPLALSPGECVQLEPPQNGGVYFWATFKSVPISVSGVSEIRAARDTGNTHPNGSRDIEPTESCAGESCAKFLSEHIGVSLFIRQAPNQSLHINL